MRRVVAFGGMVLAEALRGENGVLPLMVAHYDGFELYRGLADVGGVRLVLALAMYHDTVRARKMQAKRTGRRWVRRPVAVRAAV